MVIQSTERHSGFHHKGLGLLLQIPKCSGKHICPCLFPEVTFESPPAPASRDFTLHADWEGPLQQLIGEEGAATRKAVSPLFMSGIAFSLGSLSQLRKKECLPFPAIFVQAKSPVESQEYFITLILHVQIFMIISSRVIFHLSISVQRFEKNQNTNPWVWGRISDL